ncbi:MAG: SDR family NAD(P)-dependent oxidoreductase, partial [Hyphomicrobiales bacterium]|nr:SDR family NAD(P)-dependent oxidoreductase [Hyphomicrobiales bacterium]
MNTTRPLAVVTGASSGIGFELAKVAVEKGYDLVIAADEPRIEEAAQRLRTNGAYVHAGEADLATEEGVRTLYSAARANGRPIDALLANAGRGLGKAFLDQDPA